MRTADIIDAVLEKDISVLRAAFEFLISSLKERAAATTHVDAALLNEVCLALAQDEGAMERQLCGLLGLPARSTFRAGAVKIVAMRTTLVASCVQLHS